MDFFCEYFPTWHYSKKRDPILKGPCKKTVKKKKRNEAATGIAYCLDGFKQFLGSKETFADEVNAENFLPYLQIKCLYECFPQHK